MAPDIRFLAPPFLVNSLRQSCFSWLEQLQVRWEQPGPSRPSPDASGDASNFATQAKELTSDQGLEAAEPTSESIGGAAPVHDGHGGKTAADGESTASLEVETSGGGTAAASANVPGDSSSGAPDKYFGVGGGGGGVDSGSSQETGGVAGGGGRTGEAEADPKRSEERLLEAVGSMFGGLGGDSEGDEVGRVSRHRSGYCRFVACQRIFFCSHGLLGAFDCVAARYVPVCLSCLPCADMRLAWIGVAPYSKRR